VLEQAGVPEAEAKSLISSLPPAQQPPPPKRRRLSHMNGALTAASHVYHDQLMSRREAQDAVDYLKERGFEREASWDARFGYVAVPQPGHEAYRGRLVVPYLAAGGAVVDLKFRSLDGDEPKYLCLPGSAPRLFDARRVLGGPRVLVVCEGEVDALTLSLLCGVEAVGVPGASAWQDRWGAVMDGFDTVLVAGDGDRAGARFARDTADRVERAVAAPMPEGEDVNSLYLKGGVSAVITRLLSFVPDVEQRDMTVGIRAMS